MHCGDHKVMLDVAWDKLLDGLGAETESRVFWN